MHKVLATLAGAIIALGLGITIVPPAQAATAGSITATDNGHYRFKCGPYSMDDCWAAQQKVNPTGWIPNKDIQYDWTFTVDGNVRDDDTKTCYYTDGSTCTRYSKEFTANVGFNPGQHYICIHVIASQQVTGTSTWVRATAKTCFYTIGSVARHSH